VNVHSFWAGTSDLLAGRSTTRVLVDVDVLLYGVKHRLASASMGDWVLGKRPFAGDERSTRMGGWNDPLPVEDDGPYIENVILTFIPTFIIIFT